MLPWKEVISQSYRSLWHWWRAIIEWWISKTQFET